eukprot:TRINITY_DN13663_c0_g1_i1.p1 TRINITY_DN13663_c0_g1~~TRINITY_DN13663_c0_g1_i1.p1  ORF type:complete len:674 (+),score=215.39 TRINITY_DN13663_c0_g1_i1:66-2087(+)
MGQRLCCGCCPRGGDAAGHPAGGSDCGCGSARQLSGRARRGGEREALLAGQPDSARCGAACDAGSPARQQGPASPSCGHAPPPDELPGSRDSGTPSPSDGSPRDHSAAGGPIPVRAEVASGPWSPRPSPTGPLSPVYSPASSPTPSIRSRSPFGSQPIGPQASPTRALCLSPPDQWHSMRACPSPNAFAAPAALRLSASGAAAGLRGGSQRSRPGEALPKGWRRSHVDSQVSQFSDPERGSSGDDSIRLPSPPVTELLDEEEEALRRSLHRVKKEIYDTECTYVARLGLLSSHYLEPMRQMLEQDRKHRSKGDPQQQADPVEEFLANLLLVQGCNTTFLQHMRQAVAEYQQQSPTVRYGQLPHGGGDFAGVDFGNVFRNCSIFHIYAEYISARDKFVAHLQTLGVSQCPAVDAVEQSPLSGLLQRTQQQLEEARSAEHGWSDLSLWSLLIAPIKRLGQYEVLLKQLIGYSRADDPALHELRKACQEIHAVSSYCNQHKRESDGTLRAAELGEELGLPELVRPGRYWLQDDEMGKVTTDQSGRAQTARCRVFLFSDALLCNRRHWMSSRRSFWVPFKQVEDILDEFRYRPRQDSRISMSSSKAQDQDFDPKSAFAVVTSEFTLGLVLASPKQRAQWCDAVRAAVGKFRRRSHRRRSGRKRSLIGFDLRPEDTDG